MADNAANVAVDEVGQVAPDYDKQIQYNTLVMRPQYRITLRLGEIEDLFPDAIDTDEGLMARLQVLGLFYFPLKHSKAKEALKGKTVPLSNGYSVVYTGCWDWVKSKIFGGVDDAKGKEIIQKALKERIVSGAIYPFSTVGQSTFTHGLPEKGSFAKIRLPGAYTHTHENWVPVNDNYDAAYTPDAEFGDRLSTAEDYSWNPKSGSYNRVLGKIPLVAKVEKQVSPSAGWETAAGVTVYFQLQTPDPLPAANNTINPGYAQFASPSVTAGVRTALDGYEKAKFDASNPQQTNCHKDHGGKRGDGNPLDGSDVIDVLFSKTSVEGFHAKHSAGRKLHRDDHPAPHNDDQGVECTQSHSYYPATEQVTDTAYPHTVKTKTNAEGEAGVVFMPSRMGGDVYKFGVFLDPTLNITGSDLAAIRIDTGSLVVWRNIRLSQYIRKEATTTVWATLITEASASANAFFSGNDDYLAGAWLGHVDSTSTPAPPFPFIFTDQPTVNLNELVRIYARAYCELEFDDESLSGPSALGVTEYTNGIQLALEDAKQKGMPDLKRTFDVDNLFYGTSPPGFPNENSIAWLVMRTPEAYNALHPPATDTLGIKLDSAGYVTASEKTNLVKLLDYYMLPAFMRGATHNGYLPGISLLQAPANSTLDIFDGIMGTNYTGGVVMPARGSYVYGGNDVWANIPAMFQYDFTSVAGHELGHNLYREHAPDNATETTANSYKVAKKEEHDGVSGTGNFCLMSYATPPAFTTPNQADFCSMCLLTLRGWWKIA